MLRRIEGTAQAVLTAFAYLGSSRQNASVMIKGSRFPCQDNTKPFQIAQLQLK